MPESDAAASQQEEHASTSEPGDTDLTIGEREQQEAYADFRRELDALPSSAAFQALVVHYGQQFGYRAVGRWIAGRAPKAKSK